MFACCMLRSGTVPNMLRSDRGPEFKNAIMAEYAAGVGLNRGFGTPWRPMEQGAVEEIHVETQKVYGMMVKDIMRCFPNETAELQYVVEFVIYNTPLAHGYTPRDIDRRWSSVSPLEKELKMFEVKKTGTMSEYCAQLFKNYREIRIRVLNFLRLGQEKRRELANRHTKQNVVKPRMKVVILTLIHI